MPTAVDWYNLSETSVLHIGGQGIEVESDELKFGRRKYNRGQWQEVYWVFGGIERVTGNLLLLKVKKRDAATLVPLTQQYIRPASVIFSDEWRAYSLLQSLGRAGGSTRATRATRAMA